MEAVIGRIDHMANDAYPGKAASVVYFGGCNLKCPWCFVPQFVSTSQCSRMTVDEVKDEVAHFDGIEAVVFDGGEPLMQPEALAELCSYFKHMGYETKVQTNGTNAGILGTLLSKRLLSRVSIDVKAPFDNERLYGKMVGIRSARVAGDVKKSLSMCRAFKTPLDITLPIIPAFNDKPRMVRSIARSVAPYAHMITLIQFNNTVTLDPSLQETEPPSRDLLHELAAQCKPYVHNTRIRTSMYGEEAL